jgi:chromosome segregation ATPase
VEKEDLRELSDWITTHKNQDEASTTLNQAVAAIEKESSVIPGPSTSNITTNESTTDNPGVLKRSWSDIDPSSSIPGTEVSRQTKVARPDTVTPPPSGPIAPLDQNNLPGFYRSMMQALQYHQADMKKARAVAAKDKQLQENLAAKNDVLEKRSQAEKMKVDKLEREVDIAREMAETEKERREKMEAGMEELKNARDTAEMELKAVKDELGTDKRRMEDLEVQLASMEDLKKERNSAHKNANHGRLECNKAQETLQHDELEMERLTAGAKSKEITSDQLQAGTEILRPQNGRLETIGSGIASVKSFLQSYDDLCDVYDELAQQCHAAIENRDLQARIAEEHAKDSKKARKAARKARQRATVAEVACNVVESNYRSTKAQLQEANKEIARLKELIEDMGLKEE